MGKGNNYVAIVIAAGLSSRMGKLKPLMDLGGRSALLGLLERVQAAGLEQIIVVTGHEHKKIEKELSNHRLNRLSTIYNADYKTGMFSSVQTGIRRVTDADAALLFPADIPLVATTTITELIGAWERSRLLRKFAPGSDAKVIADAALHPPFATPVFEDKNGHPLLIPREYFSEILAFKGEGGLKTIRNKYEAEMIRYKTDDEGCLLDMDTPEDYAIILEYASKQNSEK